MIRFLPVLLAPILLLSGMAKTSAQPVPSEEEIFCLRHPENPACGAILLHYCDQYPDEPVCMSDDDEDA